MNKILSCAAAALLAAGAQGQTVKGTLTATGESTALNPLCYGIYFDDINRAADGGLYGELLQNGDFEYTADESGEPGRGPEYGWDTAGDKISISVQTETPLSENNPTYARVELRNVIATVLNTGGSAIVNKGYDGIAVRKERNYIFSMKARAPKNMNLEVALFSPENKKVATGKLAVKASKEWKDFSLVLTPSEDCADASLRIMPRSTGSFDIDMASLFPEKTFKGHAGGMRDDLAQQLADMHPGFVMFPGASLMKNGYDWKGTVGAPENRRPLPNPNGGHQSRRLGYHEFLQFCEEAGTEAVPMAAADAQDALDLIQFANGDISTEWGARRAETGHAGKFNIKYIGVADAAAYAKVASAVKTAHPEITVVRADAPAYVGRTLCNVTALAQAHQLIDLANSGEAMAHPSTPLLADKKHAQIAPALISFDKNGVYPSTDAEAMRLFGTGTGDRLLQTSLSLDAHNAENGIGAVATQDSNTGDVLLCMVNAMGSEATLDIDMRPYFPEGQGSIAALRNTLSGEPSATEPKVVTDRVAVPSAFFTIPLAPHSLTVMRLKK